MAVLLLLVPFRPTAAAGRDNEEEADDDDDGVAEVPHSVATAATRGGEVVFEAAVPADVHTEGQQREKRLLKTSQYGASFNCHGCSRGRSETGSIRRSVSRGEEVGDAFISLVRCRTKTKSSLVTVLHTDIMKEKEKKKQRETASRFISFGKNKEKAWRQCNDGEKEREMGRHRSLSFSVGGQAFCGVSQPRLNALQEQYQKARERDTHTQTHSTRRQKSV